MGVARLLLPDGLRRKGRVGVDVRDFFAALRRRWILAVVAVIISALAGAGTVIAVGPKYEAAATVLLIPPRTTTVVGESDYTQGNPLLYLGGLNQTRDVLALRLLDDTVQRAVQEKYPLSEIEVAPEKSSSGPVLHISSTATSPENALGATALVRDRAAETLSALQADLKITTSARVTLIPLTANTEADVVRKGQIRAGVLAAFGVLIVMLLAIGLTDGLLRSRDTTAMSKS